MFSNAIFCAALGGHLGCCRMLVERPRTTSAAEWEAEINVRLADGRTPLLVCCQSGRLDIVKILVENGADTDIANGEVGLASIVKIQATNELSTLGRTECLPV